MKTSEILYGASDHIERYGHCVGAAFEDLGDFRKSPACIIGAMGAVFFGDTDPAIKAFDEYIGKQYGTPDWSDSHTQAEVVAALRACAVIEASRESTTSRVVTTSPGHVRIVAARHGLELVEADGYLLATLFVPALGEAIVYQAPVEVSA